MRNAVYLPVLVRRCNSVVKVRKPPSRFAAVALRHAGLFAVLATVSPIKAIAGCTLAASSPAPSGSPSAAPTVGSVVSQGAAPTPTPFVEEPFYDIGDEIYTEDHDGTVYYYFQGNPDGTGKAKYDMRYDRNLWNTCAQAQIRIPIITKYPLVGNPSSGLGNIELGYSYNVASTTFDRSLQARIALPTEANNVDSRDTQLRFFYDLKWKFAGLSVAYSNEYDQSITRPPGTWYSSYYEGTFTLPGYSFVDSPGWKGLRLSGIYDYRFVFNRGGIFQPAAGLIMYGNINNVALNLADSWGMGEHALWKYKVEATAVARF
ncbi:MAG: hypothetical protein ABSF08_06745 [Candidatus Cybelea sp.]